tara:strand:+ start:66 stop:482 length:417 start_codon:yes stop_codon:yes gene_type:complete
MNFIQVNNITIIASCQLLILSFLGICFLQSGIDKILNYKDNLLWLQNHFLKTIFKNYVSLLLIIIACFEFVGGSICLISVLSWIFWKDLSLAFWGLIATGICLVFLFLGQRIAKDYEGAYVLVNYFIVNIIGLILLIL